MQRRVVGRGARDVEVLAADHAERRLGQLARDSGVAYDEREPERLGEQRVAGEDPDRLAVALPGRRLAAPLLVVVERRQVVVDEREGVDELERAAGREREPPARAPAASAVARQITGRTRLPPARSE